MVLCKWCKEFCKNKKSITGMNSPYWCNWCRLAIYIKNQCQLNGCDGFKAKNLILIEGRYLEQLIKGD